MADSTKLVICDNDQIQIQIDSPCLVPQLVAPVSLVANGQSTVSDNKVCVEGDELPPSIKNVSLSYMSGSYVKPGTGTVKVTLNDDNKTSVSKDVDRKILLKGSSFTAEFDVQSPAMMPSATGLVPDPMSKYSGTAQFITTNDFVTSE
jgi:hypothetical protein